MSREKFMRRQNRTLFKQVRMTPEEKEKIKRNAQRSNLNVSDYMRYLALQGFKVKMKKPAVDEIYVESANIELIDESPVQLKERKSAGG
jgi:hypothetical protein